MSSPPAVTGSAPAPGRPPADSLGARLYRARVDLGLTQQRLAAAVVEAGDAAGEQLSLSPSAVSRWEAGKFEPALRYRRHLAQVLGVSRRELFGDDAGHRGPRLPRDRSSQAGRRPASR